MRRRAFGKNHRARRRHRPPRRDTRSPLGHHRNRPEGLREELLHILAAVADNTTAVWDWAPPGTPVRGCLVLGGERRQARTRYDYGKGPVVVHTPGTLARELSAESGRSPELDERVAGAVDKLAPVSG